MYLILILDSMINKNFSNEEINFVLSLILGILFEYYIELKEKR